MYRVFHRRAVLFLLFLFIAIIPAGCKSSWHSNSKYEDTDTILKESANLKETTLKFYFLSHFSKLPQHQDTMKVLEEVQKQAGSKLNVKLDFQWVDRIQYANKIITLLASKDDFDAFYANAVFPEMARLLADNNIILEDSLLDITELFPKNAPKLYSSFTKEELDEAAYKGRIMAIPHHMPGSQRMCAVVREDFMKKYDIPEIKTFDDYEAYLKIIKDNEKSITPAVSTNYSEADMMAESYGYIYFMNYLVYKWDNPKMTLIPWEQTPEFKNAYETLKKWHTSGYFNSTGNYLDEIRNESTSSFVTYWDDAQNIVNTLGKDNLRIYPLYMDKMAQKMPITSASIIFNKNAGNPDRAIGFIEWIESDQKNYDLFMYGIEGEHYSLSEGRVVFPKDKAPYYGWWGSDAFANIDYIRPNIGDKPDFKIEYEKGITQNTAYPPSSGFIPDIHNIEGLIKARDESYSNLENNIRNNDFSMTADSFIEEQKASGTGKIVNELQRQLDRWISDK